MSIEGLYVAMAGAKQTLLAQAVNSNNLANVNTAGFRADNYNAVSMALTGDAPTTSVFTTPTEQSSDYTPGTIMSTDRDLDIAVEGQGFITVQSKTGEEVYTRAGNLQINANGQLQTVTGLTVIGNGGPISIPPNQALNISNDGSINIRPLGQDAKSLATVDRIKLTKPDTTQLVKGSDGLFRLKDGSKAPADPSVKVISRSLEGSNVNSVGAMVEMIGLARQFEMQVNMIKQNKEEGNVLAQLLQVS